MIYDKYQYKEKGIFEVISLKKDNITKIVLMDSRNIKNPVTIEDKQKISEFMKLTNSDVIKSEKKHHYSNGWQDSVYFYNNEKKPKIITFTNDLKINGEYYEFIKGSLTQNKIVELMNSANSKQ